MSPQPLPRFVIRPAAGVAVLLSVLAAAMLPRGIQAAEPLPIGAFSLADLNAASARFGQSVSPRDYGQWISAYYFGNEG